MRPRSFQSGLVAAVFLLCSTAASAFAPVDLAGVKKSYLEGDTVDASQGTISPELKQDIGRIQNGEVVENDYDATSKRTAVALNLNDGEAKKAYDLYRGRGAARQERLALNARLKSGKLTPDERAQVTARLNALAERLKSHVPTDELEVAGNGNGYGGVKAGGGGPMTAEQLAQLNAQTRGRKNVKLDGSGQPPVLADIALPPQEGWAGWMSRNISKDMKEAQVYSWVKARPTPEEIDELNRAYKDYHADTTSGIGVGDDLIVGTGLGSKVQMAFARTPHAFGVAIPQKGNPDAPANLETIVILDSSLKGAPKEVKELVLGHEIGVHAVDETNGFLNDATHHIPSELRAFVMDAKNYLEIRSKTSEDQLKMLRANPVWQQADMKARILLGMSIPYRDYLDASGNPTGANADGDMLLDYSLEHTNPKPISMARFYIGKKYATSGEKGFENLYRVDDSDVGKYNRETERIAAEVAAGEYPFMSNGY